MEVLDIKINRAEETFSEPEDKFEEIIYNKEAKTWKIGKRSK